MRDAAGRLPIDDEQVRVLREMLERNETFVEVLGRAERLGLPGWYLAAGCVYQTVWNVVTGRPAAGGIKDYDLIYFDAADLSWEAEDRVIKAGDMLFGHLPAVVEIRNEARVHLWFEQKFGVGCAPYESTEAAIDRFPAMASCVGVRVEDGRWRVYAPHGLSEMFGLVVRPNPVLATREVYEAKTARWRGRWPELTVLPWPPAPPPSANS